MTLIAKQITCTSLLFPLLPPNHYCLANGIHDTIYTNVYDARRHYQTAMKMKFHSRKHSKYIDGAIYSELFYENVEYIKVYPGDFININVSLEDGTQTVIKIFRDFNSKLNEHLQNCRRMGSFLKKYPPNTFRKNRLDKGKMFIIGAGKLGNGSYGNFKLTENEGMSFLLSKIVDSSNNYYSYIGLDEEWMDIKEKRKYKNHKFMKGSFVSSIVSSVNLMNSAHLDINDTTKSIVTWTTDSDEEVTGWYFIMPNVTSDGKRGMVLEIQDGVTINWDARKIIHCSTTKANGHNYNVFGTYFGS